MRDRGRLLPDRVVDADDVLALLVDDRVDRDRRLPGLAVADDQLALAAADRDHRVDRLEAGLHRLADRLAIDDAGRDALDRRELLGGDRALAVDRLAERVDDAAEQLLADGHRDDAAGPLHRVAFLDLAVLAEQHGADAVLLEVQRDPEDAVRELDHLARHRPLDAVHARDAVADRHDRADLGHVHVDGVAADLVADDLGDFVGFDVHSRLRRAGQRVLHLLELALHAAVVHHAADPRHDAADEGRRPRASSWRPCARCARRSARSIACTASAGSGTALVTSAWTTFCRSISRRRYSSEQVGQQHQTVAVGQQLEQLAERPG